MVAQRNALFKVVCDKREKLPWSFEGITERVKGVEVPVAIETIRESLHTGDYSISGLEDEFAIERKSIPDLQSTLTRGRDRFMRELERASHLKYMAVIIEGNWDSFIKYVYEHTNATPKSLDSTIVACTMRFQNCHWFWRPNRFTAMKTAYKIMDFYYREREKNAEQSE